LVVLGIKLRASSLLSRHSATWSITQPFCFTYFSDRIFLGVVVLEFKLRALHLLGSCSYHLSHTSSPNEHIIFTK
jgi:hypothetical protein